MKKTTVPCLLLLLFVSGAPSLFSQTEAPDDAYFLDWLEKWNRAFLPLDTAAISNLIADDFRYFWTTQSMDPLNFGEIASKAEFMNGLSTDDERLMKWSGINGSPADDHSVRRSADGQTVWLVSHLKEISESEIWGTTKVDSNFSSSCYTFQRQGNAWKPNCAFVCFYKIKKTRPYGGLYREQDFSAYAGKKFRLSAAVKTDFPEDGVGAYLWYRIDKKDKSVGAFDNMWGRPIKSKEWKVYSLEGVVDEDADKLLFGSGLVAPGVAWFDDFKLEIEEKPGVWKKLLLVNGDFEDAAWEGKLAKGWQGLAFQFINFSSAFTEEAPFQGKHAFMISGTSDRL